MKKQLEKTKKYSSYEETVGSIADDLINRDFKCHAPNQKLTTDIF